MRYWYVTMPFRRTSQTIVRRLRLQMDGACSRTMLSLHFELHDDLQSPPGPARVAAVRELAERLLQAARMAERVRS